MYITSELWIYIEQIYDSVSALVGCSVWSLKTKDFKSQRNKRPKSSKLPAGLRSSWTDIYQWRICGLIEWFKRKTNTELEQDITGQSFVGDL